MARGNPGDLPPSSSEEEDSSDEEDGKPKGVEHLIEVENPNRAKNKLKKVTDMDMQAAEGEPRLSRKEREEIEKQKARANYMKLHAEGKTDEARADLARLALIKKQREEAAKKKEAEKQARHTCTEPHCPRGMTKQTEVAEPVRAKGRFYLSNPRNGSRARPTRLVTEDS
ncbi:heat- and acid-stable phosphoprotein [Branchiostoma belcheri]|nr:heat- and acid-stable phosphoprotein [Branchiostoma belcheri]